MLKSAEQVLELGEESVPPGEIEDIARIEAKIRRQFDKENPAGGPEPARRDQHPKAHGCVAAEFVVEDGLPPELRRGLFREPRSYPAWVRFSSSSPQMRPDTVRDAHGMSIKLMDVPGEKLLEAEKDVATQDFVLANSKVFFVRSTADYVKFVEAFTSGRLLRFFFPSGNPGRWRLRVRVNLLVGAREAVGRPTPSRSVLESDAPRSLGQARRPILRAPRRGARRPMPPSPGPDFLREAMARTLATGGVQFDFLVQLQTDPVAMPVEDATILWDERHSPYRKVAALWIPMQEFDTPGGTRWPRTFRLRRGTVPDHRPLGSTNRVRRRAYDLISELRHGRNGKPRAEPVPDAGFPRELFSAQRSKDKPGKSNALSELREKEQEDMAGEPEQSSMTVLHRVLPGREEDLKALLRIIGNDILEQR